MHKSSWIMAVVACLWLPTESVKANQMPQIDTLQALEGPSRHVLEMTGTKHQIHLQDLIVGEEYQLFLSTSSDDYSLHFETSRGADFRFRAESESQLVNVSRASDAAGDLMFNCSVGCISCPRPAAARSLLGILSDANYTANELVQDVFIGGDCFDVDPASISASGDPNGRGVFGQGQSSINIEEGVILSSGDISSIAGPNANYNTGNSFSQFLFDGDLVQMVSSTSIYDVNALEFDFTPTTDSISFEFVFASEEYCEYVNSSFNDVFGFFISGPGINGPFSNGAENIAVVPGTANFITINSVNHLLNDNYYVNNIPAAQHSNIPSNLQCTSYPTSTDGVAIMDIEFDGFTTVMTALARVEACETYHIKLIIADVADGYYDSAVFLKANSFSAGGQAEVTAEAPGEIAPTNVTFEDCFNGQFIFTRPTTDLSEALTVHYSIAATSTATPDVDYGMLPDSVIIPAGDSIFYLPVEIFTDAIVEGTESIILELDAPCSCSIPFVELFINDANPLVIQTQDQSFCAPSVVTIAPSYTGGLGIYSYLWNTGATTGSIDVVANSSTAYTVTVTDFCGNTAEATTNVDVGVIPTAWLSGYQEICPENPDASLQIDLTGTGPWNILYTHDGIAQPEITNITTNPFILPVTGPGFYQLVHVTANGCIGTTQGVGTIALMTWDITADVTEESCPETGDGAIDLSISGGQLPYNFSWNQTLPNTGNPMNLSADIYQLTLTDANGCSTITQVEVPLNEDVPNANAGQDKSLNCDLVELSLDGGGSTGNDFSTLWTTTDGQIVSGATTLSPLIDQAGIYFLNITNTQTGCSIADKVEIFIDTLAPIADITALGPLLLTCQNASTPLTGSASQPSNTLTFLWSSDNGGIAAGEEMIMNPAVNAAGNYVLTVTNTQNGCTDTETITIAADLDLPQVMIQDPSSLTCRDSVVTLDGAGSSQGTAFNYQWSTMDGNILAGQNTLSLLVDQPGDYILKIYNTSNNCENTASATVAEDRVTPIAEAGLTTELDCNEAIANLDGGASATGIFYDYEWSTNEGTIYAGATSLSPEVAGAGWYFLTVTNTQNGCTTADGVQVIEPSNIPYAADILATPPLCYGDNGSIVISEVQGGEGPYLYSFDEGESFYVDSVFYALNPGNYEIIVQDASGCQFQDEITIPNVMALQLYVEPEVEINLGESYQIDARLNIPDFQIDTIFWTPAENLSCSDCLDPIVRPFESTKYTIHVINEKGCAVSGQIILRLDQERSIFIPNVFSPNGDGENDVFHIFSREGLISSIQHFQIFDRWGGKIFERFDTAPNNPDFGWDGTHRGKEMNPAVFIYSADIELVDGTVIHYTGDLTLAK